jgi:hypothetical protein
MKVNVGGILWEKERTIEMGKMKRRGRVRECK